MYQQYLPPVYNSAPMQGQKGELFINMLKMVDWSGSGMDIGEYRRVFMKCVSEQVCGANGKEIVPDLNTYTCTPFWHVCDGQLSVTSKDANGVKICLKLYHCYLFAKTRSCFSNCH